MAEKLQEKQADKALELFKRLSEEQKLIVYGYMAGLSARAELEKDNQKTA